MQGGTAEESIIAALNTINEHYQKFDLVVIIRGGGSQADLACFDSYWLASHVAQFPLPIITGIGHEKDISVVDLVAHTKLKTPTAVAEFILDRFIEAEAKLHDLKEKLEDIIEENISTQRLLFEKSLSSIAPLIFQEISTKNILIERFYSKLTFTSNQLLLKEFSNTVKRVKSFELHSLIRISNSQSSIQQISSSLSSQTIRYFENQNNYLEKTGNTNRSLDPVYILKRGYSITLFNGRAINDPSQVKKGDTITTKLNKGELSSTVV